MKKILRIKLFSNPCTHAVQNVGLIYGLINQSININFFSWRHMPMSRRKSESEAPVDGNQWRA